MERAHVPTLYLLCGKIAAGKSTLARRLAARQVTLLISEDHWTSKLFADDLRTIDDYGCYSARLRAAVGPHIVDMLRQGLSIVLDFPANTVRNRNWMRSLIDQTGAAHELYLLDVPDMICKQRLRERNASGEHPFQVSEAEYDLFTSHFVPPQPSEGFNVIVHAVTPAVGIGATAPADHCSVEGPDQICLRRRSGRSRNSKSERTVASYSSPKAKRTASSKSQNVCARRRRQCERVLSSRRPRRRDKPRDFLGCGRHQRRPCVFDSSDDEAGAAAPVRAVKLESSEVLEGGVVWLHDRLQSA
jgi:predicted kinase